MTRVAPIADLIGRQRWRYRGELVGAVKFPDRTHPGDESRVLLLSPRPGSPPRTARPIATVRAGDHPQVLAAIAIRWPRERDADVWLAHRRALSIPV